MNDSEVRSVYEYIRIHSSNFFYFLCNYGMEYDTAETYPLYTFGYIVTYNSRLFIGNRVYLKPS